MVYSSLCNWKILYDFLAYFPLIYLRLISKRNYSVVWQLNISKIFSGLEMPVFFCQILSNIHRLYSAMCGITGAWRGCVMKVSVSKSKNQTIYYLLHRPDSLSHSGKEVRWELYHWKHYKNTERNEHADSPWRRIYPWVYMNRPYRQTPQHIWF